MIGIVARMQLALVLVLLAYCRRHHDGGSHVEAPQRGRRVVLSGKGECFTIPTEQVHITAGGVCCSAGKPFPSTRRSPPPTDATGAANALTSGSRRCSIYQPSS